MLLYHLLKTVVIMNSFLRFKSLFIWCCFATLTFPFVSNAQLDEVDKWITVNKGLGKCASIGQSGPEFFWGRDNGELGNLLDRRGEMYVTVRYENSAPTIRDGGADHPDWNPVGCGGGMFRHDTIRNEWIKVATLPFGTNAKLFSNHVDIFAITNGDIFKFTTDYASHSNGWEPLGKAPFDPLLYKHVWPGCQSCHDLDLNDEVWFNHPNYLTSISAWGDTIYIFMESDIPDSNKVAKFNYVDETWAFDVVGELPHQAAGFTFDKNIRFKIANKIGGMFSYFVDYKYWGQKHFRPSFYWVWNPSTQQWQNISEGPDYQNYTGTQCATTACKACDTTQPDCQRIEDGGIDVGAMHSNEDLAISWEGKRLLPAHRLVFFNGKVANGISLPTKPEAL